MTEQAIHDIVMEALQQAETYGKVDDVHYSDVAEAVAKNIMAIVPKLIWTQPDYGNGERDPILGGYKLPGDEGYAVVFQILPVGDGDLWKVDITHATLTGVLDRLKPDCEKYWRAAWRDIVKSAVPLNPQIVEPTEAQKPEWSQIEAEVDAQIAQHWQKGVDGNYELKPTDPPELEWKSDGTDRKWYGGVEYRGWFVPIFEIWRNVNGRWISTPMLTPYDTLAAAQEASREDFESRLIPPASGYRQQEPSAPAPVEQETDRVLDADTVNPSLLVWKPSAIRRVVSAYNSNESLQYCISERGSGDDPIRQVWRQSGITMPVPFFTYDGHISLEELQQLCQEHYELCLGEQQEQVDAYDASEFDGQKTFEVIEKEWPGLWWHPWVRSGLIVWSAFDKNPSGGDATQFFEIEQSFAHRALYVLNQKSDTTCSLGLARNYSLRELQSICEEYYKQYKDTFNNTEGDNP